MIFWNLPITALHFSYNEEILFVTAILLTEATILAAD